jgi:hypothetical protein
MAPPWGLTFAGSRPRSRITASDCAANASLSSIQSRSSWRTPAWVSTLGIAFIGPIPMISGGTPATAKLTKRASGFMPYFLSAFSLIRTTAAAPSDICELLPAVTEPRAAKTVVSLPSVSIDESAAAPRRCPPRACDARPARGEVGRRGVDLVGQDLLAEAPAAIARAAFWWLATANASWSSRETFQRCATFSAVMPMP